MNNSVIYNIKVYVSIKSQLIACRHRNLSCKTSTNASNKVRVHQEQTTGEDDKCKGFEMKDECGLKQ